MPHCCRHAPITAVYRTSAQSVLQGTEGAIAYDYIDKRDTEYVYKVEKWEPLKHVASWVLGGKGKMIVIVIMIMVVDYNDNDSDSDNGGL